MSAKPVPSLFISYRRADAAANVGRLFDWLTRQFAADSVAFSDVFLDTDGIAPGERFADVLRERLAAADTVLVVIGPQWLDIANDNGRRLDQPDDYVRMEVAAALQSSKRIIPVLVGGATMPTTEQLPHELERLSEFNATPLRDAAYDFEHDFDRLVDAIVQRTRGRVETEVDRLRRVFKALKVSSLLIPATVLLTTLAIWVGALEFFTLDTRAASYLMWAGEQIAPPPDDPGVVLIGIDGDSEQQLGHAFGPLPAWRHDHARLIELAADAGAQAIAFDLLFQRDTAADSELADAVRAARVQGTRVVFAANALVDRQPRLADALRGVADWGSVCISRRLGYTFAVPLAILAADARDSATPSVITPALALSASQARPLAGIDRDRRTVLLEGAPTSAPAPRFTAIERLSGGGQCGTLEHGAEAASLLIRFAGEGYWRERPRYLSYATALEGGADVMSALQNRVVIVGAMLPRLGDRYRVTSGLSRHDLFGVEMHANAIANLLTGREMVRPPLDTDVWMTLLAAIAGSLLGWVTATWRRWSRRVLLIGIAGAYIAIGAWAAAGGLLLNVLYHATAFGVSYYVLRRLRADGFSRSTSTPITTEQGQ